MSVASSCGTSPICLRARLGWRIASQPPTVIVPVDGVTIPQMMLISVVLPAPFGPEQREDFALVDVEIDRVERVDARRIGFRYAADAENRFGHAVPCWPGRWGSRA